MATAASPPPLPLAGHGFAVVDVETSGLSARRHRILQVAVVSVDAGGTVVDQWASDVRPHLWRVGPRAVHGLTVRRLRRAPRLADLVPELVTRLDGKVLVAHNVGFDWAFLKRGLRRAGYEPPDVRRLCTLDLSRTLDPTPGASHRLGDLCQRHGIALANAHDALADARATAALLPHLLRATGAGALDDLGTSVRGSTTAWAATSAQRVVGHGHGVGHRR